MDYENSALNYKKDNKKNTNSALGDVDWFNNKENWTFNLEPNISGATYSSGQDVQLPDQTVRITDEGFGAGGNVDFNVGTPSGYGFGGGVEGGFNRGAVNYPTELQQYGAPSEEKYRGGNIGRYSGHFTTPSDYGKDYPNTFSITHRPYKGKFIDPATNEEILHGEDAWMLNAKFPVDLSKILRNVR